MIDLVVFFELYDQRSEIVVERDILVLIDRLACGLVAFLGCFEVGECFGFIILDDLCGAIGVVFFINIIGLALKAEFLLHPLQILEKCTAFPYPRLLSVDDTATG
jgi:hypothetical protein